MVTPRVCPTCSRSFFPSSCSQHCSPRCHRAYRGTGCKLIRRNRTRSPRPCVVCHAPREVFVPFPSGSRLWSSPIRTDGLGSLLPGLVMDERGLVYLLGPSKPRIHSLFCSLLCYAHPDLGHHERTRGGRKARRNHARRAFYTGMRPNNPTPPRENRARNPRARSDGQYSVFEGHFLRVGDRVRRVDDHRALITPDPAENG